MLGCGLGYRPFLQCASAVVGQLAVDHLDGAQKCKGVVSERAKPLVERRRPSSVHAGQFRELRGFREGVSKVMCQLFIHVRWTLSDGSCFKDYPHKVGSE